MTEVIVTVGTQNVVVGGNTGPTLKVAPGNTLVETAPRTGRDIEIDQQANVAAIEVGIPGPAGPPGADGGASVSRTASTDLGGHRIVRSTGDNLVGYASNDNPSHGDDTQGMTLGAAVMGAAVDVQRAGSVRFAGWTWAPEEPVFLGADGLPTQIVPDPSNGATFSQVIGHAEDVDVLYLSIAPPIYF